jgi:hypothetical protein
LPVQQASVTPRSSATSDATSCTTPSAGSISGDRQQCSSKDNSVHS